MPRFTLEHIGIAISDASDAVRLFENLLGSSPYKVETVEREGVRTYFIGDGGEQNAAPKLELLEALSPDSPIASFLDRRGPGLHHIAFSVDDIEVEMARLASLGFRLLADEPKPGADRKRIVFLHPKSTGGVLVELCESVAPEVISVPFEDGQLAAFVSGPMNAPPLVVLHAALGSTKLEMQRLTRVWERNFRVYALDFMAHGKSDFFESRLLTMELFAENVVALMNAQNLDKAHLLGFSMGGSVALYAAHLFPDRFERLAIHAHNVQWNESERALMVGAMQSALDNPTSYWSTRLAETHGENWQELVRRMIQFTSALPDKPFRSSDIADISHPTLVSSGDRDRFFGLRHAMMLNDTLPNAALAVLPEVDHPIQTVDAELYTSMVAAHFLKQ